MSEITPPADSSKENRLLPVRMTAQEILSFSCGNFDWECHNKNDLDEY